jgi:hypothetical protein
MILKCKSGNLIATDSAVLSVLTDFTRTVIYRSLKSPKNTKGALEGGVRV